MIKIGRIEINKNKAPLIIPEMGINHNGNFEIAVKIIRSAKKAGAKIIKNQTHIPEDEYSEEAKKITPDNSKINIYDLIKKCSFSNEEEFKLKKFTEKLGMEYISTPFSRAAVDRLVKLKVKLIKIGSGECNNYPLINYIAKKKNIPVILSTGMNDFKNIKIATNILKKNNIKFGLNHCTNIYPSDFQYARLNCISQLIKKYPKNPIGLSDHSKNNLIALASIPLGVSMIEKHFVDNKNRKGPDISSSMDEKDLKNLIENSKNIFSSLEGDKKILKELSVSKFAFASVVSLRKILKGEKLSLKNIWVKRPGSGDFLAKDLTKLIGKKAKKEIKKIYK